MRCPYRTDLSADEAHRLFDYDPATGALTWKNEGASNGYRNRFIGKPAGTKKLGYFNVTIDHRHYQVHRLIWLMMTGDWPPEYIDHINGNGYDNRWTNLRLAVHAENQRNSKRREKNRSGFKGVTLDARRVIWFARIQIDGKTKWLGHFATPEAAHEAYKAAAITYHKEFSRFA